jgi:hypothetical protein
MRTETYKAITRDDLTAMAAKYLKTGDALKIRIISENWDG